MMAAIAQKYDRQVHRLLEILPGFLTWALLLSPIWMGLIAPKVIIYYITFLTVFWCYLAIRHTTGVFVGFQRYKKEMAMNWAEEFSKLDFAKLPDQGTLPRSKEDLKFFILIPAVNEPYNVLKDSLYALLAQTYDIGKATLVFALEQKYSQDVEDRIRIILGENINKFDEVLFYVHPAGIPGEAIGVAGANRTWGATRAVAHLKETGRSVRDYIFITIDSDHVLNEQFLARLAHIYLTSDERDYRFYSTALHLFNNNIWDVPVLMRIEANSITLGGLSDAVVCNPAIKDTFACYASSLQTLVDANYWDVEQGVDDTLFYWRALFVRGHFLATFFYIPYSADAVQSETYFKTHKSMYKQLLRWGWGAIAVPISLKEFIKNKKISNGIKARWTLKHFEHKIFLITLVFLMTFGIRIITLVNPLSRQSISVYSLPSTISLLLTIAMVMLVPITIFRTRLVKKMPKDWPFRKKIFVLLEGPMVVVNLFTYSFIPFVEAQTRMMFGKRMKDLYHTPKVR